MQRRQWDSVHLGAGSAASPHSARSLLSEVCTSDHQPYMALAPLLVVLALWALVRLALGLLLSSRELQTHVEVDLNWWRVTLRLPVDDGGGGGG